MGLKFRRGTTAQQSGSLAFGEPYVNTTLGTLVIGGATGDIILSSTGTGSTGNFGAISGSGLDITGNANIAGNVTVGGRLQVGDNTSDTLNVVASLSSSLIPSTTNAFDLGSADKIWKDLYISTGSIKFVNPANNTIVGTLSSNANGDLNVAGALSASTLTGLGNATAYSTSVATSFSASAASVVALSSSVAAEQYSKLNASNIFTGTQTITGSLFVSANLVVQGSSSLENITASVVSIGTNTVILNTDTPSVRFGGISVQDSGSGAGVSGSLLWDSQNNHWIYQHPIGDVESAMSSRLISGPKNSGSLGEELGLTVGQIPVASGDDHLSNSIISASATKVTVAGDLDITGNVSASTISGIGNATAYSTSVASRVNTLETAGYAVSSSVASATATSISTLSGSVKTVTDALSGRVTTLEGTDISITLTGDVTGTGTITNLANVSFATTIAADSVALGTDTTGNYVSTITAGTGVSSNGATSGEGIAHTISIGQAVATSSNVQFNSLGIGMAASATAGRIDATNDIVAYSSSDIRFKENITPIENALDKISKISGNTYDWKEENKIEHGYEGNDVGVIAQEIEAVLPQLVQTRENGYKAVKYDKLVALLIEGIKEQQTQIHSLTIEIENLKKNNSL